MQAWAQLCERDSKHNNHNSHTANCEHVTQEQESVAGRVRLNFDMGITLERSE